jgi:hypothetical protein
MAIEEIESFERIREKERVEAIDKEHVAELAETILGAEKVALLRMIGLTIVRVPKED